MKKLVSFLTILTFIVSLSLLPTGAQAQVEIFNIQLNSLKDGQADLTWNTNEESKTYIYFGKSAYDLDSYIGNTVLSKIHDARLTGLESDTDYYYKIVAISEAGNQTESFVRYFNTDDMEDTKAPTMSNFKILQATNRGVGFSFTTNEPTEVDVYYGFDLESLDEHWGSGDLEKSHTVIINNMNSGSYYFMKIVAKDESDNSTLHYSNVQTQNHDDYDQTTISQLNPESYSQARLMPENAIITWRSNVLAKSEIFYGTEVDDLGDDQDVSTEHVLEHRAALTDLIPNTTYYFRLKLTSDLNNDTLETDIYSFKTTDLSWNYLDLYYHSGDIVSKGNRETNYLIYDHNKIPFENGSFDKRGYDKNILLEISEDYLNEYYTMPGYYGIFYTGQVVKEEHKSTVYVIDGKYRKPIANWMVFKYLNYNINDIVVTGRNEINSYEETEPVYHSAEITGNMPLANQSLVKSPEGSAVYLIANGQKLPFFNEQAFYNHQHSWTEVQTVPWHILVSIPTGQIIIE